MKKRMELERTLDLMKFHPYASNYENLSLKIK